MLVILLPMVTLVRSVPHGASLPLMVRAPLPPMVRAVYCPLCLARLHVALVPHEPLMLP